MIATGAVDKQPFQLQDLVICVLFLLQLVFGMTYGSQRLSSEELTFVLKIPVGGKLEVVFTRSSRLYFSVICINIILTADAFKTWLFDDGIGKAFSPRCDYYNLIRNPKWVPGKFSTALDFGNGSYAVCSRKLGIRGNTHRTVVFWCQPLMLGERNNR